MDRLRRIVTVRLLLVAALIADRAERDEGQSLAEYALVLLAVAVVVSVAVAMLGNKVTSFFDGFAASI